MVRLTFVFPYHQHMFVKSGITGRQMLKILKKQYLTLIGIKPLKILRLKNFEKVALLNQTLLNIFRNYIPNKKIKCDYRQPPWMTNKTKNLLRERSKLTKYFYRNGQRESYRDKVLEKYAECTRGILEAKIQNIRKMTSKLEDAFSAPKPYWTIINHLLYNKMIPAIHTAIISRWEFCFRF